MRPPRPPWRFRWAALGAWLLFVLLVGAALLFLARLFLPVFVPVFR